MGAETLGENVYRSSNTVTGVTDNNICYIFYTKSTSKRIN